MMKFNMYDANMINKPSSITELVSKWPSIRSFSKETGIGYEAVRAMMRRERIAHDHWEKVIFAAARQSISGIDASWFMSVCKPYGRTV